MRKACLILLLSMVWFIHFSVNSFAESPDSSPLPPHSFNGKPGQVILREPASVIKVMPDGFGGNLFIYTDSWGNRCITNNPGLISENLRIADSSGAVFTGDGSGRDMEINRLQELSALETPGDLSDPFESDKPQDTVSDPLEPINRVIFHFNDKLYFWFLKPIAKGYSAIVPKPAQVSVRDFFYNLVFPIRFINCLFQAKFESASTELSRFLVNSTVGIAGFFDPATKRYNIKGQDEDLGQTLGSHGMGSAFYINWPILGPSNVRDTIGLVGDAFLDPLNYLSPSKYSLSTKGLRTVNKTSLTIGDYEDLKRAALDPYIAVRDAYYQYRQNKIKE